MRRQTRRLIQRHYEKIVRLAEVLRERKTLEVDDVERIIGRGVGQ